jgi:hypothetical protein
VDWVGGQRGGRGKSCRGHAPGEVPEGGDDHGYGEVGDRFGGG